MYFGNDKIVAISGAAWGDEGKGKFTDEFASEADVIVRAQGGCNAGHTVVIGDVKIKLHHVPSGIAHTGKLNIIGNGVVIDPRVLVDQELSTLRTQGIDVSGLRCSGDAHLVMPWHRLLDRAREWSLGAGKIGTTARGIGPAYADKILRCGLRLNDVYDRASFRARVRELAREKERVLLGVYGVPRAQLEAWLQAPDQLQGAWLHDGGLNDRAIADSYCEWAEQILPHVTDTRALLAAEVEAGRRILLEGAQGLLLDIDHGTYPFVTSSSCGAGGFSTGAGLSPGLIDRVYNVMSAYMTRVGGGPFPTELGTEEAIAGESADQRMSSDEATALARGACDDYSCGKVIRHIAGEFGTTTGRPRRTGWLDAVAYRCAMHVNGRDAIISKLDVLDVMPVIKICTAYRYTGPATGFNGRHLEPGAVLETFPTDARILRHCVPHAFQEFQGWLTPIDGVTSYRDLPTAARTFLRGIEQHVGCTIRLISVGPRRHQTFSVDHSR